MALPKITQEINTIKSTYFPLTSKKIVFTNDTAPTEIFKNVPTSAIGIRGGTSTKDGGWLALRGDQNSSNPGTFELKAISSVNGTSASLLGKPDGTLTWGGKNVITSAGGTITGKLIVSSIQFSNKGLLQSSNDEQYKSFTITSENTWSDEVPFIVMRKIDATSSDKGSIYINAGNGTTYSRISLNADSSLNHDGRPIVSVTKWTSGNNWYRKYADGWIEQGGSFSSSTTINATTTKITFTIPFTKSINILGGFVKAKHSATYGQMWFQNGDTTLTGCVCSIVCYNSGGNVQHSISSGTCYWYACGY